LSWFWQTTQKAMPTHWVLGGRYVPKRISIHMINLLKITTAISICLSLIACEKQSGSITEPSNFFITESTVSGIALSELVNSLDSLPKQINGCDPVNMSGDFLLQCSKKGLNYTNKQVEDALSNTTTLNVNEEFGQFIYKWKSENISCHIAIEEDNDIFELWCGHVT
tara:strand:+ start:405 stop:905 length:501 start_codon:yes stop_codon:yes gene_type:complete